MSVEDDARAPVVGHAALGAQLAHRQVLGDARLHVVEAGVVGVEHLARVRPDRAAPRSASPTARRAASRGRCGSSTTRRSGSPIRSRRRSSRSACCAHRVGHAGVGDLLAVLVGDRRRRPRRAPCGSSPSACAGSTRAAASGRRTRRPRGCACAPAARPGARAAARSASVRRSTTSSVSQQLDLLREGQVGRVAGRCRPARPAR